MRPNAEEILKGVQAALFALVLPELQTDYTRTQVALMAVLLGIIANSWDGASERLVEDNGTLRELAARAADAVRAQDALASELRALASTELPHGAKAASDLNVRLAAALAQVAALDVPELASVRSEVIDWLLADANARSLGLMGPRSDG